MKNPGKIRQKKGHFQDRLRYFLALGSFLIVMPLHAIDPVTIKITGTVVANATCTFNSNETIDIDFGDVYINDITGDNYKKTVPYTLNCQGDADGKSVVLTWKGTQASFDSALLSTDVTGLGVKLQQNSTQISINDGFVIDPDAPPTLEVVLVKNSAATFSNGQAFSASVTLAVDYI